MASGRRTTSRRSARLTKLGHERAGPPRDAHASGAKPRPEGAVREHGRRPIRGRSMWRAGPRRPRIRPEARSAEGHDVSKLVLHVPGGGTRDIRLDRDRITIGRRADNDVHLPYPAVSAEHAAIVTVLEDSFLEDLQSTNGTLVNGKRITKHFLRDHDAIDMGRVQLL